MSTHYEELVQGMVEELRRSSAVNVLEAKQGVLSEYLGDEAAALAMIKNVTGVELDPALNRCYHRFPVLAVYWRSREDSSLGGEFSVSHLFESILQGTPSWLTEEGWPAEERQLHAGFRIFDSQPMGGTGTFTAIRVSDAADGPLNPEIWFFDTENGSTRLDIEYCNYLDVLLVTKGCYYWQYLFADPDQVKSRLRIVGDGLRSKLDFLAEHFPERDYTPLRKRLADRLAASA